jgi:predicted PolB exonuclease-like 3'-5' exonuclease
MKMNILVFDIETVPDLEQGARYLGLENLSQQELTEAMLAHAKSANGSTFVRLPWQKIVAISVVLRHKDELKVWSLGDEDTDEVGLIKRFYKGLEKYKPTLVSWNGSGFDLPVLHYRALKHKVSAPLYWEAGENNSEFKWNNYLSRFHARHCDLMDVLAGYQPRAFAKLDEIAVLLGYPGKMGMSGHLVQSYYQDGKLDLIRAYCETDVMNTYLVFLHYELMRGKLSQKQFELEIKLAKDYIEHQNMPHWQEFGQNWQTV